MIVCNCNALRDRDVRAAGRALRSNCPLTTFAHLGCKPKCGKCLSHTRDMLTKESNFA